MGDAAITGLGFRLEVRCWQIRMQISIQPMDCLMLQPLRRGRIIGLIGL